MCNLHKKRCSTSRTKFCLNQMNRTRTKFRKITNDQTIKPTKLQNLNFCHSHFLYVTNCVIFNHNSNLFLYSRIEISISSSVEVRMFLSPQDKIFTHHICVTTVRHFTIINHVSCATCNSIF